MIKTIFVIILTLSTIEATAQNHLVGIAGGASRTGVTSNIFKGGDNRIGFSGGITYEYFFKESLSIEAGLIYQPRGFKDNFDAPNGEKATFKYNYNYVSVPVKIGFANVNIENNTMGFVKVGLIPALLVNAKATIPVSVFDTANVTGTQTIDFTDVVSKFDLAGVIEAGGGSKVTDRLWLTVSVMYQHSLTSITKAEFAGDGKTRHNGITLQAGLKWAMKKE